MAGCAGRLLYRVPDRGPERRGAGSGFARPGTISKDMRWSVASVDNRQTLYYITQMKPIAWSPEKNEILRDQRGISFEDVVFHIQAGDILETYDHPNQSRYPGQQIHEIEIESYIFLVPFVESDDEVFLKTIIPSRKATKKRRGSA